MRAQTFTGYVVAAAHAATTIAPAYDRLTEAERRTFAARTPTSFLRALPSGGLDDRELAANRDALDELLGTGVFVPLDAPSVAVLQLTTATRSTTAVLVDLPVEAFGEGGEVRGHEAVRPARVEQLVRYLEVVGAASSPITVMHRPDPALRELTATIRATPPDREAVLEDDTQLRLHLVHDEAPVAALLRALAAVEAPVIADGHHRAAAALAHHAAHGGHADAAVLVALVATDELEVLPFHREVTGLGDTPVTHLLRTVTGPDRPVRQLGGGDAPGGDDAPGGAGSPGRAEVAPAHGRIVVTDAHQRAVLDVTGARQDGVLGRLDAAIVEDAILTPLRRTSPRLHVTAVSDRPASRDRRSARPVRPGPGVLRIELAPPDIEDVVDVARAGGTMPAKSTYLVPKLRSGVFVIPRRPDPPRTGVPRRVP